jgi:hypothetical protein
VRHEHPVLRRDRIEALRGLLADDMHGRPAARAIGVVGFDHHMNARQMSGKRTAIEPTLLSASTRPDRVSLVVVGLGGGNRLLDILKRQMQLVRIELLRAAAELRALQLAQQMLQAVILRLQVIALCQGGVPLRARLCEELLQRRDIGWQPRDGVAHAQH